MNDCGDANLERIVGRPKASTPKLRPDRCVVGQCTLPIQIDHTFVLSAMFGSNTYVVHVENGPHSQSISLELVATSGNTDSAAIDRYECDSRSPDLLPSACGRLSCRPDRQKRSALECAHPQSGQYPSRWQRPGLSLGRSAIGDDRFRDDPQRGESR